MHKTITKQLQKSVIFSLVQFLFRVQRYNKKTEYTNKKKEPPSILNKERLNFLNYQLGNSNL